MTLLFASPLRAEVPTPPELLDLIAANPRLAGAAASTDAARANLDEARAVLMPRLEARVDAKRFSSMRASVSRNSDVFSRLEVVQPIYDFGKSYGHIDAARAETMAREQEALVLRNTLMLEGLALYYELHASDLEMQALQEDNTIAFFHYGRMLEKDAVGDANPIELLDLRAKMEVARYAFYSARSRNGELRLRLAELTGEPFTESTITPIAPDVAPAELDFDKLITLAEIAQPEMEILRRRKAAMAARRDAAGLKPRIEAFANVAEATYNRSGRDDWALGARFVVPLYEGGKRTADQARLGAEMRRLNAEVEVLRRSLERRLRVEAMSRADAWQRIVAAKAGYKTLRRRLYLEQLQRSQDRQASVGGMSAKLTHMEAELARAIGAYVLAGAKLATLIGGHPRDALQANFLEDMKSVEQ